MQPSLLSLLLASNEPLRPHVEFKDSINKQFRHPSRQDALPQPNRPRKPSSPVPIRRPANPTAQPTLAFERLLDDLHSVRVRVHGAPRLTEPESLDEYILDRLVQRVFGQMPIEVIHDVGADCAGHGDHDADVERREFHAQCA